MSESDVRQGLANASCDRGGTFFSEGREPSGFHEGDLRTVYPKRVPRSLCQQLVFMWSFFAQATASHEEVNKFQLLEDDSMAMCYLPDDLCGA